MKKKLLCVLLACAMTFSLVACGSDETPAEEPTASEEGADAVEDTVTVEQSTEEPIVETKEGYIRNELSNEWIEEQYEAQRPMAVMVDNELTALPHYGTSECDIVYEMMNSTMNGRITRFMCLRKDWQNITRLGSVRSVRTTNLQIAPEYDAIVLHDGGPFYIDMFLANPYVDHLSGGFARIDNGKSREFTEYITMDNNSSGLYNKLEASGIQLSHTIYYQGQHFKFSPDSNPTDLSTASDAIDCTLVDLPFEHNGSQLEYIAENDTYRYSEYNREYKDAGNGSYLEFTNVIVQECEHEQLDDHGYMNYFVKKNEGMHGYYITGGKAIPVTWSKQDDIYPTIFYDANGDEIQLRTGKIYIALVPHDVWSDLVVK